MEDEVTPSGDNFQAHQSEEHDTQTRLTPAAMLSGNGAKQMHAQNGGLRQRKPSIRPHADEDERESSMPPPGHGRSFLLWFFIGDLGLGTRTSIAARALHPGRTPPPATEVGVILGILGHIFGFITFTAAHLIDLTIQIWEQVCLTAWLLHWILLNFTGRTVLSRCIIEAHHLMMREWSLVVDEDHEMTSGSQRAGERSWLRFGRRRKPGLNRWQVVRSLWELYCINDVTRERYLNEGAGLEKLQGWKKGEDEDSSDDEDSEEDMVVTRRDDDILQITKTPRLAPHRTNSRMNSGYFGSTVPKVSQGKGLWDDDPRSMVRSIRWASSLAISAYGLHIHIVDLPPTFTPSGERFSRQTFAHLSKLNPDDVLHAEIQTLDSEAAYSPTFYVIKDQVRKVVAVAIRGTQSFQDIIVDLELRTQNVDLPPLDGVEAHDLQCHAGIWRAAESLVNPSSKLLATLNTVMAEEPEFDLVLTGHSLGGAIASAAAVLLGEYTAHPWESHGKGRWVIKDGCGLPAGRRLRAISFAHPATVSASLSERCSIGRVPLTLSVTLGADIIPRAGHGQARELRRVLGALSRVRRRHALAKEGEDDARVHVSKSWWDWKAIFRAKDPDAVMLDRKERIEDQLWRLRCDVEADLYAAVKQRHANQQFEQTLPPTPWVGPQHRAKPPLHQIAARRQALDKVMIQNEAASGGILVPAGQNVWISGKELYTIKSPLAFFSLPDLHPACFSAHFPSAYEAALMEDIVP